MTDDFTQNFVVDTALRQYLGVDEWGNSPDPFPEVSAKCNLADVIEFLDSEPTPPEFRYLDEDFDGDDPEDGQPISREAFASVLERMSKIDLSEDNIADWRRLHGDDD